jgi:hypothetical protein
MKCVPRSFASQIGTWIILTIAAVPALAETSITTCPFRINTPGNYVLNADLTCAGDGITITTSNVSLKLNGHKITIVSDMFGQGGNAITVDGLFGGLDHVGIQGPGLLAGHNTQNNPNTFFYGVDLEYATYSQVSQVTIIGASTGIHTVLGSFLTLASNSIGRAGLVSL